MPYFRVAGVFLALALLAGCAGQSELVVLLPGDGGRIGALAVETKAGGSVLLDKPYAAVRVGGGGKINPTKISKSELDEIFAAALAAKPAGKAYFKLFYARDKTDLLPKSESTLKKLFEDLGGRQAAEVQVTGYAYFVGPGEGGDKIALRRAKIIAEMLTERGTRGVVAAKLVKRANAKQGPHTPGRVRVIVR